MIRKLNQPASAFIFITMISSLTLISCEKDPIIYESNHDYNGKGNGMFKTMQVSELPILNEELIQLTEGTIAKSESSSSEITFALFDHYEVMVATVDSTVTYTLPIIQERENNRQFSNLVLTYTNGLLTDFFILKYEGTVDYFNKRAQKDDAPFSGSMELVLLDSAPEIFAKSTTCRTVTITYCRWTKDQENNVWHVAGPNCGTPSLMQSVNSTVCTQTTIDSDFSSNDNFSGGGYPASGNDGSISGYTGNGNYTNPINNPNCDPNNGLSTTLSDGYGGCYDPNDNIVLEPIEEEPEDEIVAVLDSSIILILGAIEQDPPDQKKYVFSPDDTFVNRQVKENVTKQFGKQGLNNCASASLGFIGKWILKNGLNEEKVLLKSFQLNGTSFDKVLRTGQSPEQNRQMIESLYNISTFSTFEDALDDGKVVMTDVFSGNVKEPDPSDPDQVIEIAVYHAVAAVDYTTDNKIIFFDPAKGNFQVAPRENLNQNYAIVLRSTK